MAHCTRAIWSMLDVVFVVEREREERAAALECTKKSNLSLSLFFCTFPWNLHEFHPYQPPRSSTTHLSFMVQKKWALPWFFFYNSTAVDTDAVTKQLTTKRRACAITSTLQHCRSGPGVPHEVEACWHREGESLEGNHAATSIERLFNREVRGSFATTAQVLSDMAVKKYTGEREGVKGKASTQAETHTHARLIQCCNNHKTILFLILLCPNLSILFALSWNLIWCKSKY